ncbi:VCBS domain-containing protein [Vibrio coralliilyticus]|uniref:VCBS domain-containing protein n=1 Tax=Vibrio coralliilyticus TaxID=190893 RepID=UPI00240959A8|nr:VCBS domain-containing protein [Vibrio coralliilyticus]WFB50882.1 VCBS domain-containing protein [Vibrio coralliilyticus]
MAHSTNTHRFRSAVNHPDTYALTDTNLSSTQGSRAYRLASLWLLPSPPEGVRDRVSRMLGKSFHQADSEYAEEKNELSEWAPSPLLIDSGRLLISSGHRRQTQFDPNSVVAGKDTLGSLNINKDGYWDYSVYNIKMQFLKQGERKLESFSLYSDAGEPITVTLTLIGVEGGAVIEELATEVTIG